MIFIHYPKCSTCKNAKIFLQNNNITFEERDIKEYNPSYEEIKKWTEKYNLDIKILFNTSGLVYKNLNLKEKLPTMNTDEKIKLLSTNGMLVKRPLLISEKYILIGFKEKNWQEIISK